LLANANWIHRADWSPDESSIAFSAYREFQGGDTCNLFLRDADGMVTTLVQADYVLFGCPAGNFSFVWSTVGGEIAYSSEGTNIDAINPQTRQQRRVLTGETPSPPCNETGDVSEESAPCSIRILALARDGSRILVDPEPERRVFVDPEPDWYRKLPLAVVSFDGTSSSTLAKPTAGRPRARIVAYRAELP
jgi:hypothetical protein